MASLLDTDIATLAPLVRRGLDWWLGELADMARPLIRDRGASSGRTVALRRADGRYTLVRGGERVGDADPARPVLAAVTLPPAQTLVCRTVTPPLPRRDVQRLVENDIDRLTPFAEDEVYCVIRLAPSPPGVQAVQLVAAPRERAEAALLAALEGGIRPTALLAEVEGDEPVDLLPALRAAGAFGRPRAPWRVWTAVAVLVGLNLAAAVWRDGRDTDRLRAEVDRQQPVARRIGALHRQVQAERARRDATLAARTGAAPLQLLALATQTLPDGAWAQRFSYQNHELELAGHHRPGVDVPAAFQKAPGVASVRNASVDLAAVGADPAQGEPFDIVVALDRRGSGR